MRLEDITSRRRARRLLHSAMFFLCPPPHPRPATDRERALRIIETVGDPFTIVDGKPLRDHPNDDILIAVALELAHRRMRPAAS